MRAAAVAALAVLAACSTPPAPAVERCVLSDAESAWVGRSLEGWRLAREQALRVETGAAPTIVFYNERCAFRGEGGPPWAGAPHEGMIELPDGGAMPAQVASFAAPYEDGARVFFAMALPSIWRAGGVESDMGLETLMSAVLIHEISHTRQFGDYGPRLDAIDARYNLGGEFDDDIVQDTFRADAEYVALYQAERELLYRAVAAPSTAEARALAGQALAAMQARRARYFVADNEKLLELEDIFLTMEGLAQWAAYAWLVHPEGAAIAPAAALPGMRRGGGQWSQDEGLALFLVIDRLAPDWQARAFGGEPATAIELLTLAAGDATQ